MHPSASRSARRRESSSKRDGRWPKPAPSPRIIRKRLKLLETFARCRKLQQQITDSERASVALTETLSAVRKRSAELETALRQKQEETRSADRTRAAAEETRSQAHAALALHQRIAASVDTALAATEAARQLLPDDSALSLAVQKINEKSAELRKAGLPLQARFDAAVASLAKATEHQKSAQAALQVCLGEKARRDEAVTVAVRAQAAEDARGRSSRSELAEAVAELTTLRASQFAQAQLKPLTPEQICFSILKVTGVYDRYWKTEEAELNKKEPLFGPPAFDPFLRIARAIELERRTYEKLKGTLPPFVSIYAAAPGQPQNDFFATADQALFAANGGSINSWIAPAGGNVSQRMIQEKRPSQGRRRPVHDDSLSPALIRTNRPTSSACSPPIPRKKRPSSRSWSGRWSIPSSSDSITDRRVPHDGGLYHEVHIQLPLSGAQHGTAAVSGRDGCDRRGGDGRRS